MDECMQKNCFISSRYILDLPNLRAFQIQNTQSDVVVEIWN